MYYKLDTLSLVLELAQQETKFDNRCHESLQNPVNKLNFLIIYGLKENVNRRL